MKPTQDKVAVVLAAGKGTRMKTDQPKVAVELNGKPLLLHVLDHLKGSGVERIVVVVGYKKELVQSLCSGIPGVTFAEQKEQLGTAHALLCAETELKNFNGSVIVACGDVPMITSETFTNIVKEHKQNEFSATILSAVVEKPTGYGRIIRNISGDVTAIVEEKDSSAEEKLINEINTGTYVFNGEGLFDSLRQIGNQNAQGEYYLPDLVKLYRNSDKKLGAMKLKNHLESHGVNSPEDLQMLSALIKGEAVHL
ncbi:sugar phosphate nucleotidyltransferase [Leptospira noguchii]|uniref:MobA-like NTP transferase domain protein n=1 Tax=Leptospira noguchii TaxID=28182 RepID=M6VE09_9LEPT|nr:sugar phosphate nucleotidyltransferase [Leptospira noguchii]EMO55090.1 MobA-like NTP transferase domain protein [Leptospira noguchii]